MSALPARPRRLSLLSTGELDRARVLDTLVNNLDGMAYRCLLDASWRMIFVSQGCLALTGYSADELVHSDAICWEDITYPLDWGRDRLRAALAERGIVGASPDGHSEHVPSLPVRGEIDIVGAGDSVSANLLAALAAGATLREAMELANLAASIVVHQLGTTGSASVAQLRQLGFGGR